MNPFEFSGEQRELRAVSRAFATDFFLESEVHRLMETAEGYDRAVWQEMARQLGLQGLIIPERYGGGGAGSVELAIVLDEIGRRLAPVPFLSTVLATVAILQADDVEAAASLLPRSPMATASRPSRSPRTPAAGTRPACGATRP